MVAEKSFPKITALSGPLKGSSWTMDDEISIGRELSNRVPVGDVSLSRHHCVIRKDGEQFKILDLDSLNGTFVDGMPIKERILSHECQIEVGYSTFLFLINEEDPVASGSKVLLDPSPVPAQSTTKIRIKDATYLQEQESLSQTPRAFRDLNILLKIASTIQSIQDSQSLYQHLFEWSFDAVPADHGAILLKGASKEEFTPVFSFDRETGLDASVRVSLTIIKQAAKDKTGILGNEVQSRKEYEAIESLAGRNVQSFICIPIIVSDQTEGVLYLDTNRSDIRFEEQDLQLLMAMVNISATAFENIRRIEYLENENKRMRAERTIDHNMIGESSQMREIYESIAKVAPTDCTVLIHGESGTGKELVALAIHQNSTRSDKPFIAINCAALTESLLESELFGHEKGAFTGAVSLKKGKIEIANTGTLFLDEIAELTPPLQAKLLRVLQTREFERVGGTTSISVDIRVLAATNKDLMKEIESGTFRKDLYYRLNVVSIPTPPLKDRKEDILLLASYFVAKFGKKLKRHVMGLSPEARAYLLKYDWPGNVRELENAMERAVVLGSTSHIILEDLPESILETSVASVLSVAGYHQAVNESKKQILSNAIRNAHGNYTEAAKALGLQPTYLHRLLRNMDLKGILEK